MNPYVSPLAQNGYPISYPTNAAPQQPYSSDAAYGTPQGYYQPQAYSQPYSTGYNAASLYGGSPYADAYQSQQQQQQQSSYYNPAAAYNTGSYSYGPQSAYSSPYGQPQQQQPLTSNFAPSQPAYSPSQQSYNPSQTAPSASFAPAATSAPQADFFSPSAATNNTPSPLAGLPSPVPATSQDSSASTALTPPADLGAPITGEAPTAPKRSMLSKLSMLGALGLGGYLIYSRLIAKKDNSAVASAHPSAKPVENYITNLDIDNLPSHQEAKSALIAKLKEHQAEDAEAYNGHMTDDELFSTAVDALEHLRTSASTGTTTQVATKLLELFEANNSHNNAHSDEAKAEVSA